ncbi:cytochrome P450 4g15-like isoform X2 [Leptidea sinapis]|uniref:cytochrome P450 4g15-like isoform X2 n=1 Tax=Leptidea sinapis TaxID=189913 RepID=UPI002124512C|nr:cytochrome P450 4g15-like isoform X2 [Leptidea sinapis]
MLLIILFVFILLLMLCYGLNEVRLRSSPLVPSIPNAIPAFSYGLSKKDLFTKLMYMGEFTNKHNGAAKFNIGPIYIYNPVWKKNRRFIDNAFKPIVLDSFLEIFNKQSKRLVSSLRYEENKTFDITDIITRNILEIVCQTTLGFKTEDKDIVTDEYAAAVQSMLKIMTERVQYPWLMLDFIFKFSSLKKKQDEMLKIIWSLTDEMVTLRRKEYQDRLLMGETNYNDGSFRSYLDILIENSDKTNEYTNSQLRNIVDNLMLAGYDTSTYQILFALICLGTYPEIQEKAYQEICKVMDSSEKDLTKEDLSSLTYLEAVIKETIRLYPIGPVIARHSDKKVQLKNFELPSGVPVVVHVWSINRNPEVWGPDADQFRPERWLDPNSIPSNPAAFASFGPGRRNCIGKSYSIMLMKTVLSHFVYNYKITSDHTKLQFELVVMLKPYSGHLVKIEKRSEIK